MATFWELIGKEGMKSQGHQLTLDSLPIFLLLLRL
jgi:hypothetical protein